MSIITTVSDSVEENIELARYTMSHHAGFGQDADNNANFIMANEYLDFCEFLEGELGDEYNDVRERFFKHQAQANIDGYAAIGFFIKAKA